LRNVSGFVSAAGKRTMLLKYRGVGEVNLEFGAVVGNLEHSISIYM
jgi:hypothetical protein